MIKYQVKEKGTCTRTMLGGDWKWKRIQVK